MPLPAEVHWQKNQNVLFLCPVLVFSYKLPIGISSGDLIWPPCLVHIPLTALGTPFLELIPQFLSVCLSFHESMFCLFECSWHPMLHRFQGCNIVIGQAYTLCCAHCKCSSHLSPHNMMTVPFTLFSILCFLSSWLSHSITGISHSPHFVNLLLISCLPNKSVCYLRTEVTAAFVRQFDLLFLAQCLVHRKCWINVGVNEQTSPFHFFQKTSLQADFHGGWTS